MHVRLARMSFAVGVTALVAVAAAGCGSSSGTAAGGASTAAASPLDAVRLAAKTVSGANSFTGTMALRVAAKPGAAIGSAGTAATSMAATFTERVQPSLVAEVAIGSFSSAGTTLPAGLTELITPATFYLKWSYLTQQLHLSKPWLAIPVSAMSKSSGVDFGQLFSQVSGNGPLAQSKILTDATAVRQVGTGSIDGVPVTEYTGQLSLAKSIESLTGSDKAQLKQEMATAGFTTATFTVWIDAQHIVRKSVVVEAGKTVVETITTTITSINQPVTVSPPPASQTAQLPAGAMNGI